MNAGSLFVQHGSYHPKEAADGQKGAHYGATQICGKSAGWSTLVPLEFCVSSRSRWNTATSTAGTRAATPEEPMSHERMDIYQIIQELLKAGARREEAGYPTGNAGVDDAIR